MKQVNYFWFTFVFIIFTCKVTIFCQQIYLSPTGDNANPGTKAMPLATLNAARDKAREYRKENKTVQPVEIIASEGEYFMMQPLELTTDDAGSTETPLVIKAEPGKKAVFRGGVRITGWEKEASVTEPGN